MARNIMTSSLRSDCTIALGAIALTSASAHAALTGLVTENYQITDGARRYSVMDVFVQCTNANDKLVNFYGTTGSVSYVGTIRNGVAQAAGDGVVDNGANFAQMSGTGWLPSAVADAKAWDSFVTIGARSQQDPAGITGDPSFSNANVNGAGAIVGSGSGSSYRGAGWYTSAPTGSHVFAGTYGDNRIMLGRFAIDVTDFAATDVLQLRFAGNLTMRVDGTSQGTGTIIQPSVSGTFNYSFVPAPGALALLGSAGLPGRRSRRR
jgi:hypothetical protein